MKFFSKQNWKVLLIIVLGVLFFFKSCQSCSRKQEILFYKYDSGKLIDSLTVNNESMKDSIATLNYRVSLLENELKTCRKENAELVNDKNHLRSVNKTILNSMEK